MEIISEVQTTKQTTCAIVYLQGITFKVEKLESLKILEGRHPVGRAVWSRLGRDHGQCGQFICGVRPGSCSTPASDRPAVQWRRSCSCNEGQAFLSLQVARHQPQKGGGLNVLREAYEDKVAFC